MQDISLIDAVNNRNEAQVDQLIAAGAPLEERDERGSTPLWIAAASEQYIIAEKLVTAGADPFTMDSFYITAAAGILSSDLMEEMPDGAARLRLLDVLTERGVPMPPPPPSEMPEALRDGRWPAHAAPPPLEQ